MEARDSVPSFGGKVMRFPTWNDDTKSPEDAGAAAPQLGMDGIVLRTSYPQVPPKLNTSDTRGNTLCPTLDAILKWPIDGQQRRKRNSL